MSFAQLLKSEIGRIFLINLHETYQAKLMRPRAFSRAVRGLHTHLAGATTPLEVADAVRAAIFADAKRLQVKGVEKPDENVVLTVVRPFGDLVNQMRFIKDRVVAGQEPDVTPAQLAMINAAIAPLPTLKAIQDTAALYNGLSLRTKKFSLGWRYGLFWATNASDLHGVSNANGVRDKLGLVQYSPTNRDEPYHLFSFEAVGPVRDIKADFRMARPTSIDGFDNRRFRQHRAPTSLAAAGCGVTTDLSGGVFGEGAAECVATRVPIRGHFECRYIGLVDEPAVGTDRAFIDVLAGSRSLSSLASALDGHIT